jgi:hypothetical protein
MAMDQAEQLSSLIGEIYDAALGPSLWSDIVGKAGRFVGGSAASIYSKSPTAMTVTVHYQSGIDPYYLQIYLDKYVKLDPTISPTTSPKSSNRSQRRISYLTMNCWKRGSTRNGSNRRA